MPQKKDGSRALNTKPPSHKPDFSDDEEMKDSLITHGATFIAVGSTAGFQPYRRKAPMA